MSSTTQVSGQTRGLSGTPLVVMISIIAALGGLLFGYDTGIIGVALLGLSQQFVLDDTVRQLVTASIIAGALVGCVGTGPISDRLGRRRTALLVGLVFAIGSVLSALSPTVMLLVLSRFVLGLAAGSATQIIPVYIAEVTPPAHRGKLVVMFQFMVVFGVTCAYFTGFVLGSEWRWMFALGVVPAVILMLGMLVLPESPRWLLSKGREKEAMSVLQRVRSSADKARAELDEIKTVANQPQGTWKDLGQAWLRPAIIVGVGIAMFSQITGNNAIIYYAPTILTNAGFGDNAAVLAAGGGGILITITTLIGSLVIDKVGRRRYLLSMIPGSVIALLVMGWLFQGDAVLDATQQWLVVTCLVIYMALNCGSFGVCIWLIISEIYPLFVRGKGASIGAFSHWGFDLIVTLTTLSMIGAIGLTYSLWLYALTSCAAMVFIYFLVPETSGRSLEEIEQALRERRFYPFQHNR